MYEEVAGDVERRGDFAAALREAIVARGVTLSWLRERLTASGNRVSAATLSYWRSGARRPEGPQSLSALAEIESLLRIEAGSLRRLVGPSLRVGPVGAPQHPVEAGHLEHATAETLAALGSPPTEPARDVLTTSVTEVGLDGFVISRTNRTLMQCTSGTITGVPCLEITPGVRTPAPVFTAVSGGRITRVHSHPSGEVHGALFEFERPLGSAQTTMLEYRLSFPPGYPPSRDTGHGVSRRARDVVLWTRFHPEALPDWIEETEAMPGGTTVTPLFLDGATTIHQVRQGWGPGMLTLEWGYGERD